MEVPAAGRADQGLRADLVVRDGVLLYGQSGMGDWRRGGLLVLQIKVVVLGFFSCQDGGLLDACPHSSD
jgi:hypothetical protein